MKCPKCENAEMAEEQVGDVTIDRCPECHGIWFDVFELEKVLAADPRPLLQEDRVFEAVLGEQGPRIDCPRCKGTYLIKLNSRTRPGTIVDSCKTCFGTWLDAGEFTRLVEKDWLTRLRGLFSK